MKKTSKKINKLLKITLFLCMVFSQLASPIQVLASEIAPSYNLDITLNAIGDNFIVTSNGEKEVVEEDNYIIETIRSFKYTDGTLNEEENKIEYKLVLGSLLNTGVGITRETFSYNGVSYVDINVYEISDDTIDFSTYTEEDYKTLLSTDKVVNIMNTSFEEGVSYNNTSLVFNVTSEGASCDTTDGYKCTITKNDISDLVNVTYTVEKGDLNPNKKYHTLLKVNGVVMDLITEDVDVETGELELDFSKMLPGTYSVEYLVRDEENKEIISDTIEFTYANDAVTDKIDFIENAELSEEVFLSYTTLTEEEKEELGNIYKFLDNPLTFIFDSLLINSNISSNYNLFDEEGNRYHIISSQYISGAFNEDDSAYKVSDVLNELETALADLSHTTYKVVDKNGNDANNDSYIENGMKLVVNILGETFEYDFLVYGDVDGGYVEESDISTLIDKVLNNNISYYDLFNLDFNDDGEIDVFDISILGLNIYNGYYGVDEFEIVDTITTVAKSTENELFTGETFEVLVSFDGFEENYINAIDGYITYDDTALRLDKIECLDELFVGNSLNNRFIYATEDMYDTNNETFIKLTFTALKEGTHKVSVNELTLVSDGMIVSEDASSNEIEVKVNRQLHTNANLESLNSSVGYFDKTFSSEVLEYTLYVDSSVTKVTLSGLLSDVFATTDDLKEYTLTGDTTIISVNVTAEDGTVKTYKITVIKVYKSSNNNLSNIEIEGYDIDFDKDVLEYRIKVGSDVTSLDINAIVEHFGAWAKIEGNENFKEGENIVTITVYAEDGSTKTYKLIVEKEAAPEEVIIEEEEEPSNVNTEKVVIIILIILVVLGLIYLIFKKDEDEEEPRIEQIKPKKDKK